MIDFLSVQKNRIANPRSVGFPVLLFPILLNKFFTTGLNPFLLIFLDRKSTRLNSSHVRISYAVFCLKKKKTLFYVLFGGGLLMLKVSRLKLPVLWLLLSMVLNTSTKRKIWTVLLKVSELNT